MNMENYRDFVGIRNYQDANAYANNAAYVDTSQKGQVYMDTHKGENRLPFMNRSFISFTYGGKYIEDFNLIATTENNRMNRTGSAEFEDLVDQYNILDGQFYWGTHFKPNKISFRLATDGMTQNNLDDFKHWFAAGYTRELILAEHPNRAIMARVSVPPSITMLPFEKQTTVKVAGADYTTSTTLYKGEILLELVMDLPFWYSKINIFGYYDTNRSIYVDKWWDDVQQEWVSVFDATQNPVLNVFKNADIMKIVLEDNIPISSMITTSMLLGNNTYANMQSNTGGHISYDPDEFVYVYRTTTEDESNNEVDAIGILTGVMDATTISGYVYTAPEYLYKTLSSLDSTIKSKLVAMVNSHLASGQSAISTSISISNLYDAILTAFPSLNETADPSSTNKAQYIVENADIYARIYGDANGKSGRAQINGPYMAEGTGIESLGANSTAYFYYAGTAPSLPELSFKHTPVFTNFYISSPANSYAHNGVSNPYNTFTVTSLTTHKFKITTPNIFTAYNEVIKIFQSINNYNGHSWEEIRTLIRDNVKHYYVRSWANKMVIDAENSTIVDSSHKNVLLTKMQQMFLTRSGNSFTSTVYKVSYVFNGSTGKAIATFKFNTPGTSTSNVREEEEDVSDMIKSSYLIITDRNHPDEQGNIVARKDSDSDFEKTYCHELKHDIVGGIQNLYIKYDNMYL